MGQHETDERWYLVILGRDTEKTKLFISLDIEVPIIMYAGSIAIKAISKEESIERTLNSQIDNKGLVVLDVFECGIDYKPQKI